MGFQSFNYYNEILEKALQDLSIKREELIISNLRANGFDKIADTYKTSKFPKVRIESYPDIDLYYADDGTEDGKFIVGIYRIKYEPSIGDYAITLTFNYTTLEPVKYKPLTK